MFQLHLQVLAQLAPGEFSQSLPDIATASTGQQRHPQHRLPLGHHSEPKLVPTTAKISLPQHSLALELPTACAHSSSNWYTKAAPDTCPWDSYLMPAPAPDSTNLPDTWYMQCRKGNLLPKSIIQDGESLLLSLIHRNRHRESAKLRRQRNIFLTNQQDKSQ